MNRIEIPAGAQEIIHLFRRNCYEAFVVGGCVRDSLLGLKPHDWDICTSAKPDDVLRLCVDRGIKTIETGLKHGTVTVIMEDNAYEVTTFRVDSDYSDNRHPDSVRFTSILIDDLARRDFTMNAMAYNDHVGLVDPFCGARDLENGKIVCVGNPAHRFQEDALRVMRALRFASTYGFSIEENTANAVHQFAPNLNSISAERIQAELCCQR